MIRKFGIHTLLWYPIVSKQQLADHHVEKLVSFCLWWSATFSRKNKIMPNNRYNYILGKQKSQLWILFGIKCLQRTLIMNPNNEEQIKSLWESRQSHCQI